MAVTKSPSDFTAAIEAKNAQQLSKILRSQYKKLLLNTSRKDPRRMANFRWKLPPPSRLNVIGFTAESGILTAKELEITSKPAADLSKELSTGKLTCLEVATAFCKAAAVAHQVTNCLTEIFFEQALKRAKELDEIYAKTGKATGPLFGMPISLKDQFQIKGTGEWALLFLNGKRPCAL